MKLIINQDANHAISITQYNRKLVPLAKNEDEINQQISVLNDELNSGTAIDMMAYFINSSITHLTVTDDNDNILIDTSLTAEVNDVYQVYDDKGTLTSTVCMNINVL